MQISNSRIKIILFLFLSLVLTTIAMATETPKYNLIIRDGDFETRQYEPRIIAEVFVSGNIDTASGEGFRTLASFIFGDNSAVSESSSIQQATEGRKIAMTAPVTVEPYESGHLFTMARNWRVEFTMPSQYTMTTLPKPNNPSIRIKEIPIQTYAVVRYSGMNTEERINDETRRLLNWVRARNLKVMGVPELARYNPPWTLPIFRRNEILVAISNNEI